MASLQMCVMRPTPDELCDPLPFLMPHFGDAHAASASSPARLAAAGADDIDFSHEEVAPAAAGAAMRRVDAARADGPPLDEACRLLRTAPTPQTDDASGQQHHATAAEAMASISEPLPPSIAEPLLEQLSADGLFDLPAADFEARVVEQGLLCAEAPPGVAERAATLAALAYVARAPRHHESAREAGGGG